MDKEKTPPGDDHKIRCPRLGHMIHFSYCRVENTGLPCFKTLDCWFEHFMVEEHLSRHILEKIAEVGKFEERPGTGIAIQIDVEDAVGVAHQIEKLANVVEAEL